MNVVVPWMEMLIELSIISMTQSTVSDFSMVTKLLPWLLRLLAILPVKLALPMS